MSYMMYYKQCIHGLIYLVVICLNFYLLSCKPMCISYAYLLSSSTILHVAMSILNVFNCLLHSYMALVIASSGTRGCWWTNIVVGSIKQVTLSKAIVICLITREFTLVVPSTRGLLAITQTCGLH